MFSKTLLVFFVVYFLSNFANGQRYKKFFRKDYTYIETTEGFYKIHASPQTWAEAKRLCALEGASLFYPGNRDEANAVISFWKSIQPNVAWVFIGMSDILSEGVFETVDGKSAFEVYNQWQRDEPNDFGGNEDCVHLSHKGNINDMSCDFKSYFICKKSLLSLEWNYHCNMSNLDYTFDENNIGKCYKLHSTPLNWMEAHAVCRSEESYLAVINNQLEADYLAKLTESASNQRVGGDYFRGIYHMGFHNRFHDGWQKVTGTPLTIDARTWWDNHQPNEDDREHCGSMFYTGRLNIVNCDTKSFFICEHETIEQVSEKAMSPSVSVLSSSPSPSPAPKKARRAAAKK